MKHKKSHLSSSLILAFFKRGPILVKLKPRQEKTEEVAGFEAAAQNRSEIPHEMVWPPHEAGNLYVKKDGIEWA